MYSEKYVCTLSVSFYFSLFFFHGQMKINSYYISNMYEWYIFSQISKKMFSLAHNI